MAVVCESDLGENVPVLLVHGFNSDPDMWGDKNGQIRKGIDAVKGVKSVEPFNYEDSHAKWVTDPAIGLKLAYHIDCLAQNSLKTGGQGKVIVVAHSMGGLAVRYAASQTVDGRGVADEIGLVITLGTPNKGSLLGNGATSAADILCSPTTLSQYYGACTKGSAISGLSINSKELKELPHFPSDLPVRAIAGNVTTNTSFLFGEVVGETNGDMVVSVDSATAEWAHPEMGGGMYVFGCQLNIFHGSDRRASGACEHNNMVNTGYIQESVVAGISDYLAANTVNYGTFTGLKIPMMPRWLVRDGVIYDMDSCAGYRCAELSVQKFDDSASWKDAPYNISRADDLACIAGDDGGRQRVLDADGLPVFPMGKQVIGGVEAEYFELKRCRSDYYDVMTYHVWKVTSKHVIVTAVDYGEHGMTDLAKTLQNARWE